MGCLELAKQRLPEVFSYKMAVDTGMPKSQLYRLRDEGSIELIDQGLYRFTDEELPHDLDLIAISQRAPSATLCLTSALAHHDLTDEIPARIDIAVPRGQHRPRLRFPIAWHQFDQETFHIGRTDMSIGAQQHIGIYNAERCIIDAFRLRHVEGFEIGIGALQQWLRKPGSSPAALLGMAESFPRQKSNIRHILEILL